MRVVVDYDVDRLQVYNGDIKPSSTNCPNLFLKRIDYFLSLYERMMVSTNLREQVFLRVNAFTFQYVNPISWVNVVCVVDVVCIFYVNNESYENNENNVNVIQRKPIIEVVIALRSHPFPFRTGSLSSATPMVLHLLWESR